MRATTLLRTFLALKTTRDAAVRFKGFGLEAEVAPTTRVPYCSVCLGVRGASTTIAADDDDTAPPASSSSIFLCCTGLVLHPVFKWP